MTDISLMNFPGKLVFGINSVNQLISEVPSDSKIMLVTGESAKPSGLLDKLKELLDNSKLTIVCGIMPEPTLDEVDRLIAIGRENQINAVVAVGGGSVIDTAKAAACIIANEGNARDYFYGKRQLVDRNGVFLAALPTTSGTGAEVTPNSVFIDPETKIKKSIRHECIIPDLAIVDPALTVSAPRTVTAASGLDALTQAIEAYTSKNATEDTDKLAAKAVKLIYSNLETACNKPENLQARSSMAEGSMLTALAFSQCGLGAVHGIGHPLGSNLHLPHGLTCAILLVPVLEWNKPVVEEKLNHLAELCGGSNADEFINMVRELRDKIGVASDFAEAGLKKEHFDFIVKNCRSGSMKSNPREMSDADIVAILEKLI